VAQHVWRVVRLGESAVAERLAPIEQRLRSESSAAARGEVAYLASPQEVVVRLTVSGGDPRRVGAWAAAEASAVREALAEDAYGGVDDTLPGVVVRHLIDAGASVATAESLTAGGVAAEIATVPGASAVLRGGMIAYHADLKEALLAVPAGLLAEHGPVHPDVALAMAGAVRERLASTWGVATTGVAGPGPADGHPAGTVHIAVVGPGSAHVVSPLLTGDRAIVRARTVMVALDALRRSVRGLPPGWPVDR
jgi:nicotinamide-nucleotide amidase